MTNLAASAFPPRKHARIQELSNDSRSFGGRLSGDFLSRFVGDAGVNFVTFDGRCAAPRQAVSISLEAPS